MHMLFLRTGSRGPDTYYKDKWRGSRDESIPDSQRQERELTGPKMFFNRRGEGGEGRVRMQSRNLRFCVSFVHVFNGYVASLSATIFK